VKKSRVVGIITPALIGVMGAMMLFGLYMGIVSLAESPSHAARLFWEDRYLVIPIMAGFGVQLALYSTFKLGMFPSPAGHGAGSTTAAGGGMSTAAMVACCAHHVADALPILGLSAAAAFLAQWRVPFMVVGLITNLIGIGVMLRALLKSQQHRPAAAEVSESQPA